VTVVDRGGYSAAAEHLGLAQATVSFHVRSLEQRYAVPLMRYEHRAVRLRPPGQRLYQTTRIMLAEEEHLVQVISGRHSGQVKLGASMAFEQGFFFTHVVAPFHRAHEDILLSLRFGHSVAIAEAVLEHHLDLGYLIGWHIPSGLRYEALHRAAFTFLVAREHPLASRGTVTVADIAAAGLITAPLDQVEWAHYADVLHEVGLGPADVALEVDGVQARVLATQAGLGVLGVFWPPYAGAAAHSTLTPLSLDQPAPTVDVGIVHRRSDLPSDSVQALHAWLRTVTAGH
jgi:DNA-binding transcriptional LysR family regulator